MFNRWSATPDPAKPGSTGQDGDAVTPPWLGSSYASHPAALPAPPSATPPPDPAPDVPPDVVAPDVAPWSPSRRFDAPGPARAGMAVLDMALPPAPSLPSLKAAPVLAPKAAAAPSQPPAALLEESVVLESLEAIADRASGPAGDAPLPPEPPRAAAASAPAALPDPSPAPAAEAAPVQPEPAVAWPEPAGGQAAAQVRPAAEPPRPLASLWAAEPVEDGSTAEPNARARRRVAFAALAGVAVSAGTAAFLILPHGPAAEPASAATYNAPMLVLRAARAGQVRDIAVRPGQAVAPASALLTLHANAAPDPASASTRVRLETARARLAALDDAMAQPTPTTDAGRARLADLRQQRAAAAADAVAAQDAADRLVPDAGTDTSVLANVHGVVRSVETQAGADASPGTPLVRLLDCDHAFLTIGVDSKLRAGDAVRVRLPDLPPAPAVVRRSAGLAEPPDSLVVPLASEALGGACPVGSTASISPMPRGS